MKETLLFIPSTSLYEAISRRSALYTVTAFDNIASYGEAIGILIGSWYAGCIAAWLIWYIGMLSWRTICCRCCNKRSPKEKDDNDLIPKYHDHDASANKPRILPVASNYQQQQQQDGIPRLLPQPKQFTTFGVGESVGTVPLTTFKSQSVVQTNDYTQRWHGHVRNRYESYLHMVCLFVRVGIVTAGVIAAFQSAGVNVLSLAASLGVFAICFSMAANTLLANILCAMSIHGTDKLEMRDYILCGRSYGLVTNFGSQCVEVTDDLSPWKGRQIHHIPNRLPIEMEITVFPDGPPPEIIKKYFDDLKEVNEWRSKQFGLPPIEPIEIKME